MIQKKMTAKEARDNFTDLLGAVYYGKEPIMVEKKGRVYAVVINPEEYIRYRKAAKERFFETVEELHQSTKGANPKKVLKDVTQVVEEVREKSYGKGRTA